MGFCKNKEGIKVKCHSKIGLFCHLKPCISYHFTLASGSQAVFQFCQHAIFLGGLPPVLCMGLIVKNTLTCVFHRGNIWGQQSEVKSQAWPVGQFSTPGHVCASYQGSFCVCGPPAQRLQTCPSVSKQQGNPPSLMQEHDSVQVVKLLHKYAKHILYNRKDLFVLSVRLHVLKA